MKNRSVPKKYRKLTPDALARLRAHFPQGIKSYKVGAEFLGVSETIFSRWVHRGRGTGRGLPYTLWVIMEGKDPNDFFPLDFTLDMAVPRKPPPPKRAVEEE